MEDTREKKINYDDLSPSDQSFYESKAQYLIELGYVDDDDVIKIARTIYARTK